MAIVLGYNAKIYYQTDGVGGSAGWVELTNATDVTINLSKGEADVTTRANVGWRATVGTLKDLSVSWSMVWDDADPGFTAIKNAFLAEPGVIGLRVYVSAGGDGPEADFDIVNFTRNEQLAEALTVDVEAKITYSATPPVWNEAP